MITASPVPLQRTTNTLFSNGPDDELVDPDVGVLEVGGAGHALEATAEPGRTHGPGRCGYSVGARHGRGAAIRRELVSVRAHGLP